MPVYNLLLTMLTRGLELRQCWVMSKRLGCRDQKNRNFVISVDNVIKVSYSRLSEWATSV